MSYVRSCTGTTGRENQIGTFVLILDFNLLDSTIYVNKTLECFLGKDSIKRWKPCTLFSFIYSNINMGGNYLFSIPEAVVKGEFRNLLKQLGHPKPFCSNYFLLARLVFIKIFYQQNPLKIVPCYPKSRTRSNSARNC